MIVLLVAIINIIILFGAIFVLTKQLLPGPPVLISVFISAIITLAVLSFIYFIFLVVRWNFDTLLIFFTLINLIHLYWTLPYFKGLLRSLKNHSISYDIIPVSAMMLMSVFFVVRGNKFGFFDGWALWNTHAKFLYNVDAWTNMFADKTYESSSDYPLMLPALVAFFWRVFNGISFVVPLLMSFLFLAALPLAIYYALKDEFKNILFAVFGLSLLIVDYNFESFNSEQCADILLSLFILMVFITYNYLRKSNFASTAYIVGFICASCTWIKNEGDLFYVIFTSGFIIINFKNPFYLKKYLLGSIIPLIATISFKELYASAPAFFASNHSGNSRIITDIKDLSRYSVIAKSYVIQLIDNFWIGMVFIFSIFLVNRGYFKSFYFIVFFLMFMGYTAIYLITPYDISWHIYTSFHRLLNQLYPSFIFTAIISYKNKYSQANLNVGIK